MMKRLFIILLVLFTFLLPNSASARDAWVWAATSLIGGATGSIDGHAYVELQDKDICITGVQGGKTYHHVFNSASAAAESSPDVILPDDVGASNGRWLLIDSYSEKLDGIEVGSTKYPDVGEQAFLDADHTKLNGITALADVTADNAPKVHAASHTNGTDDIQSATNAQKGVATAAHITAIEANTDKVTESTTITTPDANVTAGIPITFADTGIMAITESGDTITFDATEVDGSTTNEINTIQGDDDGATTGLAISVDGAGIVTTDVVGDVLTVTGTEVDGSVTNELNIFTTDDAEATAGTAIVIAGGGINATTEAADTITITATEADTVIKAIGTAQGDIIYWTGANTPARLAKGTATQVLTMNAGATAPEWATGGGGSGGNVSTSGTPVDNDFAKFVDGTDIEGRSYSEVRSDLNVADGATANSSDATLLARTNHTGTQTASTISDFDTEVGNNTAVALNTAKDTNATHTGDVTGSGALTIGSGKVTEAMQVLADNTTQDVSSSKHGYAPKGDGTTTKFLNANGAYSTPSGGGDVSGPATNTDEYIPQWNGADSKTLKNGFAKSTLALSGANTDITSILNAALYLGRDSDNKIDFATDDTLKIKIGGVEKAIVSISAGAGDNDKLVTQGYVDDNAGAKSGYDTIDIPAGAMIPCTTNGAEASTQEYGTNDIDIDVLAFDAGATEERVQFTLVMQENWNRSTIKAKFYWGNASGASASDTVEWGIKAGAISNDDPIDAALGTAVVITDTVITDGDLHVTSATPVLTVGGTPALGDLIQFEVYRNTDGTDDMAEDAWLIAVVIQYQKSNAIAGW